MDEADVRSCVDLDGGWGEEILDRHLKIYKEAAPDRFHVFGGVNWEQWNVHRNRFGEWAALRLREQARRGAAGLKVWKSLGLRVRDQSGALVAVDDQRLDPLWAMAGELRVPVMIHVGDPAAFFEPLDERNERRRELERHPDWHWPARHYPTLISILDGLARVVERHPKTIFIGAHVGCYAENLDWVGALLDRCPNFFVDISSRIAELGRQPYSARRFCINYSDRVLFGVDSQPDIQLYRTYFRFLESGDEYFPYSPDGIPWQGDWRIYGLSLPNEVLARLYHDNASKLLNVT